MEILEKKSAQSLKKEWRKAIEKGLQLLCDKTVGLGFTQKVVAAKMKVIGFDISDSFLSKVKHYVSPGHNSKGKQHVSDEFLRNTAISIRKLLRLEGGYEFNKETLSYYLTQDSKWEKHEIVIPSNKSAFDQPESDLGLIYHTGGRWSHEAKIRFMKEAQHEVIEFGLRLRAFRDYMKTSGDNVFYEPIRDLLKDGIAFRCYMLDPDSNIAHLYFSDLEKAIPEEKNSQEIMRNVLHDLADIAKGFAVQSLAGEFEVNTYNHIPHNHFYIIDKDYSNAQIIVSHYIYGVPRGKAPVVHFSKKSHPKLFNRYLESFEKLTTNAKRKVSSHTV